MVLEYAPPERLQARTDNPRLHSEKQIARLMDSIRAFDFCAPVLVDADDVLIAGHGRLEAARRLGLTRVPFVRLAHLRGPEALALTLADNRLAELSTWDDALLKQSFKSIALDEGFDLTLTGFEAPEIDAHLFGNDFGAEADEEPCPPLDGPAIARLGDLWTIGPHRLICADALAPEAYAALLDGALADQVLTDPPFNVAIEGNVSGKGKIKHRDFVMAAGEMSENEFIAFLTKMFENVRNHAKDGALVYAFMDGAHLYELLSAARSAGLAQKAFCTWGKTNAGMGSLYRSQTEHVGVFRAGKAAHRNNVQLGRFGRNRTTLWSYPGMNTFGANRQAALAAHSTVKPVGLLKDAILDASPRDGLVLDPFAGSGSTLLAAHRAQRRGAGIELDPLYVDVALRRLSTILKIDPIRADGVPWSKLAG
ncbi:MAG: site-specific DNA-methyltransferase [Hyphomonadaceae bacterium]